MIYDAARPKCAHAGCDNTPEEDSDYCIFHDPNHFKSQNSYTSTYTTAAAATRPATTTANNVTTRKTTNETTDCETGEYDVQDYDAPENFYEDHYDDFWDYEETEDYWEENN